MKRLLSVGGLATLVVVGLAVTRAAGETSQPPQDSGAGRAAAYLTATRGELAGTTYTLSSIRLEHRVDGREVYSLRGPDSWCILVAGAAQAPGHSQSLSCVDANAVSPDQHMVTGFELASGQGYVDLVWAGDGPPTSVASAGADVDLRVGPYVIAAIRADDTTNVGLRWTTAGGGSAHVDLLSRDTRTARERAALARQADR